MNWFKWNCSVVQQRCSHLNPQLNLTSHYMQKNISSWKWLDPTWKCVCGTYLVPKKHLPIWEGVRPFLASLKICSLTSSEVSFSHWKGEKSRLAHEASCSKTCLCAAACRCTHSGNTAPVWQSWLGQALSVRNTQTSTRSQKRNVKRTSSASTQIRS